MKKSSKYQQYFHCFNVCILVSYGFWFSYQQNIVTILISAAFRGAALIRGNALIRGMRLFQCGYPKVWLLLERRRLLEGGAYLRSSSYQRKYSRCRDIELAAEMGFFGGKVVFLLLVLKRYKQIYMKRQSNPYLLLCVTLSALTANKRKHLKNKNK